MENNKLDLMVYKAIKLLQEDMEMVKQYISSNIETTKNMKILLKQMITTATGEDIK